MRNGRRHGRRSILASRAPRRSVVRADYLDGIPDPCLERESFKRHEHVPDLFPRDCLAVNDDERQATIAAWIPLDPADEAVSVSQLPTKLGLVNVTFRQLLPDASIEMLEHLPGIRFEVA